MLFLTPNQHCQSTEGSSSSSINEQIAVAVLHANAAVVLYIDSIKKLLELSWPIHRTLIYNQHYKLTGLLSSLRIPE